MMMGHSISRSFEGTLHVDKIHERFKIANITHTLPVPVHWQTDFTQNGWSFRVYMIPLRDFVPEWNSRCGATTGLNSRRGDSRRHDILWWFHENKCWAMRGYRTELAAARKSPRCRVNTPWELLELRNGLFPWPMFSSTLALDQSRRKKSLCYCKIRFQKNQSFLQPPFLSSFSVGKRPKRL